jgi:lysozyme
MTDEGIKVRIKIHEGFRNTVYMDHLGNRTIGYGHLVVKGEGFEDGVEYSNEKLNEVFEEDFAEAKALMSLFCKEHDLELCDMAKGIIIEMMFQLGPVRTSKFKKMIEALKNKDYKTAADEMIDSRWHKQTPERCKKLADFMRNCKE